MPLSFYPYEEDLKKDVNMPLDEKLEILFEAAERYKALVTDPAKAAAVENRLGAVPADLKFAFNWDSLAEVLREVRQLPEMNPNDKRVKSELLMKFAEIYEMLRSAKMQKLEVVRLALVNEANNLRGAT